MAMKPHLHNLVKRFTTSSDQKATTIAEAVGDLQKPDASALGPQQKATIEKATFGAGSAATSFFHLSKFGISQFLSHSFRSELFYTVQAAFGELRSSSRKSLEGHCSPLQWVLDFCISSGHSEAK